MLAVRFYAATLVLLLGFGWLILSLFLERRQYSLLETIPVVFGLSVGTVSVLGTILYLLGANLTAARGSVAGLLVLLIAVNVLKERRRVLRSIHSRVRGAAPIGAVSQSFPSASTLLSGRSAAWERLGMVPLSIWLVAIFAALCTALAAVSGPWLTEWADSFMHLSAARRLIQRGEVLVEGLYYARQLPGLNPHTGGWHLILALLGTISRIGLARIWLYLPPLLAPMLVLSLYAFTGELFQNRTVAAISTLAYFLLAYRLDFRAAGYANQVGLALFWIALSFSLRYLRTGERRLLFVSAGFALALAALHFTPYEFFFASLGLYAGIRILICLGRGNVDVECRRVIVLLAAAAMLSLPFALYKVQSSGLVSSTNVYEYAFRHPLELGRGLFALDPTYLYPLDVGDHTFNPLIFIFQFICFVMSLNLLINHGVQDRIAGFLFSNLLVLPVVLLNPFLLSWFRGKVPDMLLLRLTYLPPYFLVFGWYLHKWGSRIGGYVRPAIGDGGGAGRRLAADGLFSLGALGLALGFGAYLLNQGPLKLYNPAGSDPVNVFRTRGEALVSWEAPFDFLGDLPSGSVVLSDPETSFAIAGLTGQPVLAVPFGHQDFQFEALEGPQQRREAWAVLNSDVGLRETGALLRKRNVDYVVVNLGRGEVRLRRPQQKLDAYPGLFERIYQAEETLIYRVHRERLSEVIVRSIGLPARFATVTSGFGRSLSLNGYALDNPEVPRGTDAVVTLRWQLLDAVKNSGLITLSFVGKCSGFSFEREFTLGELSDLPPSRWEVGELYADPHVVFLPREAPVDSYAIQLQVGSANLVPLGWLRLRERFEAEEFSGVTVVSYGKARERVRIRGWTVYERMSYSGSSAALTQDLEEAIWRDLPELPAGDYQVRLRVYDYGTGRNAIRIRLGGVDRLVEWSGPEAGKRWLTAEFSDVTERPRLSITPVSREQPFILVDALEIAPSHQ